MVDGEKCRRDAKSRREKRRLKKVPSLNTKIDRAHAVIPDLDDAIFEEHARDDDVEKNLATVQGSTNDKKFIKVRSKNRSGTNKHFPAKCSKSSDATVAATLVETPVSIESKVAESKSDCKSPTLVACLEQDASEALEITQSLDDDAASKRSNEKIKAEARTRRRNQMRRKKAKESPLPSSVPRSNLLPVTTPVLNAMRRELTQNILAFHRPMAPGRPIMPKQHPHGTDAEWAAYWAACKVYQPFPMQPHFRSASSMSADDTLAFGGAINSSTFQSFASNKTDVVDDDLDETAAGVSAYESVPSSSGTGAPTVRLHKFATEEEVLEFSRKYASAHELHQFQQALRDMADTDEEQDDEDGSDEHKA